MSLNRVLLWALASSMCLLSVWRPFCNNNAVLMRQESDSEHKDKKDGYDLAFTDSLGLFDDIPNSLWKHMKEISRNRVHKPPPGKPRPKNEKTNPAVWYQLNYEVDFSCPLEEMVGPLGDHKWACSIHRLPAIHKQRLEQGKPGCLVYSFGSRGKFEFEEGVLQHAPECEIHIFDPDDYSDAPWLKQHPQVNFHPYGLKASYETEWNRAATIFSSKTPQGNTISLHKTNKGEFQSLQEITAALGHQGRTVDIFKIDCDGCEWFTYRDWLTVDARQILVETHHNPPIADDFFNDLHEHGYVMFHKEPNIQWSGGKCIEFSFLKLGGAFFEHGNLRQPKPTIPQVDDKVAETAAATKSTPFI